MYVHSCSTHVIWNAEINYSKTRTKKKNLYENLSEIESQPEFLEPGAFIIYFSGSIFECF